MFHLDWTWDSCQREPSDLKRQSCITSLKPPSTFQWTVFFHWDQCFLIFYIFLVSDLKKSPTQLQSAIQKEYFCKEKMWKCRHSSENSILHSTEPLRSLLNDPFYHGAMSVPFWIVRPGKKNRCMYTSGWVMYYSYALCSFWQTDLIKGKKAIHCDKLNLTRKSELEVLVPCYLG